MLKGQDIVVLLKLLDWDGAPIVREVADSLAFDVAGTHRSIRRLERAGLYSGRRLRVTSSAAEEYLIHGAKYNFPPIWQSEARGIPTSWAAPPLKDELAEQDGLPPVWPFSEGRTRGLCLEPIHAIVPTAALRDQALWQRLALFDAIRSDRSARVTELASSLLRKRLGA